MDKKNRRSSLRRQPPTKEDDQTATSTMQNSMLKRRISFSGKKSVRVFVNTEEPHYWENSYELSDCTNGEDNSKEQAPKTGPSRQAPTADKENVHIDMTLNLRTSIDVPMFPCETNRNRPNCSVPRESLFAESFSLSSIGREKLKDTLYSHRITDKTIDLMQITSKVGDDCSLDLSTLKKEHMKGQPTTFVSDSLMDITPLGFVDPVAASVPVPVEKDNDNPVQKSFKEVEECRKDSQRQGDISFDCDINDFSARDRMPSNGSSDTDSNNSTINYLGDESALIPFDMISGNNISKKLNFRQLNDDLEAGKIKVFANGPRTPTTDPRAKQKKFWHGLDEDIDQDQQHKDINIRSIKPRGPLNFSVNMTMSPLAQATPVARVVPLPREKLKIPDDKRKYRLSQADEVMLDNTNFLAHAKLGDETQSRNSSKIFTRRETTYESLELDVGLPNRSSSCSQNFPPSTMQEAASKHSKPRQTIHLPAKMEQDVFQVEQAATAIPPGRSSSSSARRTLNLNESMDQDIVEEKAIVTQSEVNVMHKGAKSKRRETLLMEESMEEDIISPLKELHLKASAPPKEKEKSKTRQTLHLAKPFEEDEALPRNAATTVAIRKDSKHLAEAVQEHLPMANHRYKARQTILQAEPIEGDVTGPGATRKDYEHLPEARYKARQTILQAEPIEEDVTAPEATRKDYEHLPEARYKARQTILQAEPIEEDVTAPGATRKDYEHLPEAVQKHLPMANHRYKARQTILQAEPIEEDVTGPGATRKDYEHLPEAVQKHLPMANHRYKARQTILQAEPIEEDVTAPEATRKDYEHLPEAAQKHLPMANHRYKARQTILQAEPIEEDVTGPGATRKDYEHLPEAVQKHLPMANHRYKARQTILQAEPVEEDVTRKDYEHLPEARYKARQTILQAEPIEEDVTAPGATRKDYEHLPEARYKARQTILQAEPIEEDVTAPGATRKDYEHLPEAVQKHLPMANHRYKARQTILQAEPIEEDVTGPGATRKDYEHLPEAVQKHLPMANHRYKARQTILQAEPVEEDVTRKDYEHLPEAIKEHLPTGNHRYKGRQTILQAEPIEEDVTPRKDYEHFPEKKDYKHLAEPVQAHHVSDSRYRSSKSRQTLLMAEAIEENHSTAYHSLEPKISQEVREKSVAFEPINTLPLSELIEESKAALRTSKARQTLPLAAPMDVEGEEPPTEPPLEESTKVAPSRGSRAQQTLIMSESMEEQEEEVDFHSPIQSIRTHPELLPITPMLRLNGSGSVCSMDEFELFEEESKQAATPRGPLQKASVLLRKIRSMGESMKMSFEEDTSGCGTPIRHSGNAKRLSDHLTPNLPEAKKRNTHLLADSKTEQEMEMDMSVSIKEVTTAVDKNCDLILRPQRPVLEQRPITISDVSAYFQAQPCKVKKKPAESKTEKEDEEKRDTCPRYSGSSTDRSFKSYEPTNKRFINLSGDTNSSTALMGTINVDEMETSHIDKVRLSLVSTLADEPDTDEEAPVEGAAALAKQPQPEPEPESCQEQQASSRVVAAGSSASCRKCMNCRRSLNETRLSNDSFVLPSQPQWDLTREIEMLRRVRARPNLDDVHKYWEMKEQERQTIALEKELDSSSDASDEEFSEWDVNEVMAGYNRKMERFKRNLADKPDILQQALVRFEPVETFFDRLAGLLTEQQPNWIFDYQLKISRKLIFTHRLLTTFRLIVDYETVDDLETAIRVCALNVEQATLIFPLQSWTAFEHLLDFQLQLKMPVSHTDSIEGSSVEAFAQFLQRTDTICVDVLRTFHKLLKVLTTTKASLLRQGNQMVIKKTVRRRIEVDTRTAIEKTDFVIEVANVEGISFRDILHPRIHFFNENIQYLPVGVAFLEEFLDHPEQYLKT
ncbi:uncharacterized protein LOC6601859 isoform X19 [Drosophila persimilis]|uniref:uncharacterized protein LOC6601859 isoform X19 n=1 Tax=Drosophila persimilis TaxID=7234 RepID=UPI000F08B62E|nr:uncharacterized protein LOC6601859 isoform X19 [Drosophila persimilis]